MENGERLLDRDFFSLRDDDLGSGLVDDERVEPRGRPNTKVGVGKLTFKLMVYALENAGDLRTEGLERLKRIEPSGDPSDFSLPPQIK
jgi:hypothetical protein